MFTKQIPEKGNAEFFKSLQKSNIETKTANEIDVDIRRCLLNIPGDHPAHSNFGQLTNNLEGAFYILEHVKKTYGLEYSLESEFNGKYFCAIFQKKFENYRHFVRVATLDSNLISAILKTCLKAYVQAEQLIEKGKL